MRPNSLQLPPHAFIFNAVADADRSGRALERASAIAANSSSRIINDPQAVARTGRAANAKQLTAIENVRAAAAIAIDRRAAPPFDFPFLLRVPGHHTGRYFLRVDDAAGFQAALRDLPGDDLLAMEFIDTRSSDGYIRKYRMMIVDGQLYPAHLAVSREWKVHYMHSETVGNEAFEREERRFLDAPESAIGAAAIASLQRVAATLALDYAGIDFGMTPAGIVAVFEANAQMILLPPEADAHGRLHRQSAARIFAAARAMLLAAADA